MERPEITAGLSELLEQHLERQTGVWAKEVEVAPLGRCRPDYMSVSASWGKFAAVSSIERAEVTVYRVKSCMADYASGSCLNAIGDYNYLLLPYELMMEIDKASGWGMAYPFPASHGRVPDPYRLPAYEGQTDGWNLYWIRPGCPKSRPHWCVTLGIDLADGNGFCAWGERRGSAMPEQIQLS